MLAWQRSCSRAACVQSPQHSRANHCRRIYRHKKRVRSLVQGRWGKQLENAIHHTNEALRSHPQGWAHPIAQEPCGTEPGWAGAGPSFPPGNRDRALSPSALLLWGALTNLACAHSTDSLQGGEADGQSTAALLTPAPAKALNTPEERLKTALAHTGQEGSSYVTP